MGINYDYVISPRLGRTNSKEQYAFFYNTDTVTSLDSYTYDEKGNDIYEREPFVAYFKAKNGSFDFLVIDIHVDPDAAKSEINDLPNVITDASNHFSEKDVILLGDMNADCQYLDENDQTLTLRNQIYRWLITNDMDSNVAESSCTYDRIITTLTLNEDFAGSVGVFRFDQQFELDCPAKEISDHYPVYAEFFVDKDTD